MNSIYGVGFAPGIGLSPQFDTNAYVTNKSYSLPLNGSGGVADFTLPSSFGVITSTASAPRVMQFGLRLEF